MGIWPLARLNIYKVKCECKEKSTWSFYGVKPFFSLIGQYLLRFLPRGTLVTSLRRITIQIIQKIRKILRPGRLVTMTPLWNSSDTKVNTSVKYFKVLFSIKASDFLDGFHIRRSPESIQAWCGKRWTMVVRILAALQRQALPFTASVWRTPSQPPTSASILYRSKHSN